MSLKDLTEKELDEKFEMFLFDMDDNLEAFIDEAESQGYNLDYSLKSLTDLENYLTKNKVDQDSDDVNNAAAYFGEVVRKKYGGKWICSLDMKNNSLYYGKPVISGHTTPDDLQLSPFDTVLLYIISPRKDHFLITIENDLDDESIDLSDIKLDE